MERLRAAAAGFAVVVAVFGWILAVRVLSRFLRAIVWFIETVATFEFALLLGYLAYRVRGKATIRGDTEAGEGI